MIINKDNLKCKYIDSYLYDSNEFNHSYWYNNIIIDQSKEKLNNNYVNKIEIDNNEFRTKYNDFKNTVITKSNNTRENTPNNYRTRYREQDSNNRKYDKEKSSEYRVFQECPNTNKNKGKMYDMSEKCRVHEHKSRERKILLDSFSKSNLIKHINT
jgi:hypothetical protein